MKLNALRIGSLAQALVTIHQAHPFAFTTLICAGLLTSYLSLGMHWEPNAAETACLSGPSSLPGTQEPHATGAMIPICFFNQLTAVFTTVDEEIADDEAGLRGTAPRTPIAGRRAFAF